MQWAAGKREALRLFATARVQKREQTEKKREARKAAAMEHRKEAIAKARAKQSCWTKAVKHPVLPGVVVRSHTKTDRKQYLGIYGQA